eukprot:PITA_06621
MSQLKEGKAPGPDGFTTTFFHTFRELIKLEVWQVVEEPRALHWLLHSLNSAFIALIPKEEESSTPDKFRPIALCNVIYKVISKVIANRLKPLLPLLISPEQSGYVEGRQILDGLILSHEIIHSLKHSKQAEIPLIDDLERELHKRGIRHSEDRDILRWGYMPKVTFTTSEAYKIMCADLTPPDPIWNKIWGLGSWPKVSFFLWLVGHQRILTWDKIRRRNYHGPSICVNCKAQEDTIHHLLDACPLANQLWEKASFRCQRLCRLQHWQMNPYKSGILNHLWNILPGLLLWSIWKERNKRIFKDQCSRVEIIWSKLCVNLKETLLLRSWTEEDLLTLNNEKAIWENWNLQLPQEPLYKVSPKSSNTKKASWTAPPKHSFKLNFDGALKGNPGIAGFGEIFRNDKGSPLLIYYGNIGWDTNNSAELEGLWQGLILSRNQSIHPPEVDGDS